MTTDELTTDDRIALDLMRLDDEGILTLTPGRPGSGHQNDRRGAAYEAAAALNTTPDTLTVLTELRDRARSASTRLRDMARDETAGSPHFARIDGKRDGVDLVISYIDEEIRQHGGQP